MNREEITDLYFMDARSKLIDLAAFLDRLDRYEGADDYRMAAFRKTAAELMSQQPGRAARVLTAFSDPTEEPIVAAGEKGASGAWSGDKD
ncbi:MAG TPA: hypothetical protein EYQ50_20745 [Verrucomicrobiales bacterium]|jgi:hypothetical protein|nr:hypothetical protein [Verrucomicrobiales bacterium]HIL70250.1 hypothetical protein [Verrucomicrobiota bacterium]